jgi:DNA repair photolyase
LTLAAQRVEVGIAVSLAIHDPELQRALEPGTPTPKARLDLIRTFADAGFRVNVMVAPVIPYLTDSERHLDELLEAIAGAGAAGVTAFPMHLRGSTRGWFLSWLAEEHPALVRRYRQLYGRGAYVSPEYSAWLRARIDPLILRHGLSGERSSPPPSDRASQRDSSVIPVPTLF